MIRITGGRYKGRNVYCPKGDAVRPTTAFVRESLFSILGPRILDARVLDLYAGSGIVGFEALSRGAAHVVAVEGKGAHVQLLKKSAALLELSAEQYRVQQSDVLSWLNSLGKKNTPAGFDWIYMDPPYADTQAEVVLEHIAHSALLNPEGLLIWETAQKSPSVPPFWACTDRREYGRSILYFLDERKT